MVDYEANKRDKDMNQPWVGLALIIVSMLIFGLSIIGGATVFASLLGINAAAGALATILIYYAIGFFFFNYIN